jgi:hypothetical protein
LVIVPGAPWLQFLKSNVIGDRLNAQEEKIELDGGAPWLHEEFHAGEIGRIFAGEARILVDEGGVHLPKHAAQRYWYSIDIRVHTQSHDLEDITERIDNVDDNPSDILDAVRVEFNEGSEVQALSSPTPDQARVLAE